MPANPNLLPVSEAAREAAAKMYAGDGDGGFAHSIRLGKHDGDTLVQAFARFEHSLTAPGQALVSGQDRHGLDPPGFDPSRKWRRYRFRTYEDDPRPTTFPPPGPYWVTGYGYSGKAEDEYAILVAYLPGDSADEIEDFWPEADLDNWSGADFQWASEIVFTSRFQRPDWWTE